MAFAGRGHAAASRRARIFARWLSRPGTVSVPAVGSYQEALDALRSGANDRARELSGAALAAARSGGDRAGQVDALCMLARVALREGDFARVREWADEARACARGAGDRGLERMPLHMQAVAARMAGRPGEARVLYEESIELNRSLGEEPMVAAELHSAAFAAAGEVPDPDDAVEQQRLCDQLTRELTGEMARSLHAEGARLTPGQILDDLPCPRQLPSLQRGSWRGRARPPAGGARAAAQDIEGDRGLGDHRGEPQRQVEHVGDEPDATRPAGEVREQGPGL